MPPWLLALHVVVVWSLWVVATPWQRAVEDARQGIPPEQRGGVSIFPVIPIAPILFWSIGYGLDLVLRPWGSWIVGGLHTILAICLVISFLRNQRILRRLDGPGGRQS